MENQSATTTTVENGANAAQEVSSTTQSVEPNKRSLRVDTWRKIQETKCGVGYNSIFNRIPTFVGNEKAAALFSETEEFKKANSIKVNIDRALQPLKLQTLMSNKTLYLPSTRDSSAFYFKVNVPEDATTEEQKKQLLNTQDVSQNRTEINLDNIAKLDIVVIGSVLVSRDGYRIGRGNGFADLDIGMLIEVGSITPNTLIATMVHDVQVVDTLPINLFQKYDTPVDLIITPTEIVRVANRLPRPTGIFWELLSERRLKLIPALQVYKEHLEKAGKVITIKAEDTDIEQNQNNRSRRRGPMRRRFQGRRQNRRALSQTDNEQQGQQDNAQPKRNAFRNRRFVNRRRRPTKSEGDQSGAEGKSQEGKSSGAGGAERKQQKPRKNRPMRRDFCVKLTNLTREVRVKDLKSELRKRECNPLYISWKGSYGKCYLHFGNRNGTPSTEEEINKVMQSLNDLSLTVTTGGGNTSGAEGDNNSQQPPQPQQTKVVNVSVELVNFDEKKPGADHDGGAATTNGGDASAGGDIGVAGGRIESVDTTTV